jgi:hypothetical protein
VKPPYHPDHQEQVITPTGKGYVVALCSCGWTGRHHSLTRDLRTEPTAARLLADDLNEHRATYL